MKGPITGNAAGTSAASSRSNSIEITDATTIAQLRGLDLSESGGGGGAGGGRSSKPRRASGQARKLQHDMGRSLNFLNLDHRKSLAPTAFGTAAPKTAGGGNPRLRMMQLRLNRLKKTSPQERMYQSDSALFSSANASGSEDSKTHKLGHDVWFKSLYPKQGALEKLEEAEAEFEESQRDDDDFMNQDMNTSGTDMWLFEANHSAPGFLPGEEQGIRRAGRRPSAAKKKASGSKPSSATADDGTAAVQDGSGDGQNDENMEEDISHIRRQQGDED